MSTTSPQTIQVLLPELGESVTEGTVVEWRVAEGDVVEAGQTLLDVTTDKVDVEVPAPAAGRVSRIVVAPGDTIEVGALLAELAAGDTAGGAANGGGGSAPAPAAPSGDGASAAPAADGPPVPIVLPDMESVTEGTVVEWRVAVGDAVEADQVVLEVSTDKVDLEVPAPVAGRLLSIAVPAGETFTVGQPLGEIAPGAGGAAPAPSPAAPAPAPAVQAGPAPSGPAAAAGLEWPAISPIARRIAIEKGLDPSALKGTGPGGIIRSGDVQAALAAPAPTAAPAAAAPAPVPGEETVPLRGPAAALAGYMDESLSVPTATSYRTISVAALDAQRRRINADMKSAGIAGKLSFTHLIAWAVIRAVDEIPVMGTGFATVEGKPHKLVRDAVNLGLAVDVERKDGSRSLMVPVVRDAASGGFDAFRTAFDDLVGRTRAGQIKPDELRGATVSLTNPGGIGTVASAPRLMAGQGTIVATGAIGYPPGLASVPADTLKELGVSKVMTMSSTYDHRVIQGAESGEFLARVDALLSGADGFYEDVRSSLGLAPAPAEEAAPAPAPAAPLAAAPGAVSAAPDPQLLEGIAAAMSVVKAHRSHGHLAARLDPLGSEPPGDPALSTENVGLTPEVMARIPAELLRVKVPGESFAAALPHLREAYCGTIAYEIEHLSDHQKRLWLRGVIESGRLRAPLPAERRVAILQRLVEVDAFERFLRRTYLGQKTFSIEGVDTLVSITDHVIQQVADAGASEVVMGMAHRGRLAFITHVVGRPPESIIAEFEGHMAFESGDEEMRETAGDVKYHLGAEGEVTSPAGRSVTVKLAANPSHLEQVNAVAEGYTRAVQTVRSKRELHHDPESAVPVLIHGDAAFIGQGVVAETLNLSNLRGYSTGGTVHIIANNQIGFTTDPFDSRSTYHCSDLARGFDIPVIHVNADDVDACISAAQLAVAYRERYQRDVLINLIGYRRLGHNELDEPAYTQPVMSRTIKAHPPVSKLYAQKLIDEGLLTREQVDEMIATAEQRMRDAHEAVTSRGELGTEGNGEGSGEGRSATPVETAVPEPTLRELNEQLLRVPDGFTIHPKLRPQLDRRREALDVERGIAWAHAESLAFASLLTQGVPVRLTGQDSARGTFSQRHLELHDVGEGETWTPHTGRVYTPLANLPGAAASLELHNSPLSEAAAVGFEYGYSTQALEALVIWEAQYGDFANGAQIMIDQFIVSGRAKWGEASRLTMLLPHGYEGNGPEHSSARIERFLQAAAEDNIVVANCSTAANYFHLLRKQALTHHGRPLIIFTPKSLLRAKAASSSLSDLTEGRFQPVYDDPRAEGRRDEVTRLILCSGKVFHELDNHDDREARTELAIGRVELLYPFPDERISALIAAYPNLKTVTWVQEEPRNMGAWEFARLQLERLLPEGVSLEYVGRARRASTSEGYPQAHQAEQERLLKAALNPEGE
ncbi:multifunctional oxoglutarate decarboxylase/oxoglutarate dehydrogenase thiamine pyrophosphate-binding subunit/dihydrolipoyllysine-residue succinyltransferase subunit [Miltoncostaea marina]|uniref:multifunctional oxoglutarate decarboxylase/oxoglutarate dehydrogenase thiamine pyrophosphate-binding subunit/dihydrolipoyllysine-residue succinyltransferase subunit n=1 Tax=Miltoncostaea marina TaxID=2843215 RepID=UPI001C3C9DB3|nr:multifunctional oxoglutarate decarboxylase/oxoglutarate dehydrogenase thiamine pyrophosphate-binding subunit/dihydrolipoyllysine-residue succinyltransferase subunit [Miltoncostaea marina]